MPTEHTHFKNAPRAGESNSTDETVVIGKGSTYQRPLLIVAGSLLTLLLLIAGAGTSGDQHTQSSTHEIAKGAVTLKDYQPDSIFGLGAVPENNNCKKRNRKKKLIWSSFILFHWYTLTYNLRIFPSFIDV